MYLKSLSCRAERSAQHGEMWKTNILGSPTIMVFGEADCRRLLKEEGNLVEVIWPDVTAELVCGQCSLSQMNSVRCQLHKS